MPTQLPVFVAAVPIPEFSTRANFLWRFSEFKSLSICFWRLVENGETNEDYQLIGITGGQIPVAFMPSVQASHCHLFNYWKNRMLGWMGHRPDPGILSYVPMKTTSEPAPVGLFPTPQGYLQSGLVNTTALQHTWNIFSPSNNSPCCSYNSQQPLTIQAATILHVPNWCATTDTWVLLDLEEGRMGA